MKKHAPFFSRKIERKPLSPLLTPLAIFLVSLSSCSTLSKSPAVYKTPKVCIAANEPIEIIFSHRLEEPTNSISCPHVEGSLNYNVLSLKTTRAVVDCNYTVQFEGKHAAKHSFRIQTASKECPRMQKVRFLNTDSMNRV